MLRHACGFDLAHRGTDTRLIQGFLGHKNIQHTVKYTEGGIGSRNSLSQILKLIVFVPDANGVSWFRQCHVGAAVVFTLDQELCMIFGDCPNVSLLPQWRTVRFHDFYLQR
jgi:hypothetical protein